MTASGRHASKGDVHGKTAYGTSYADHLIEQYKVYVQDVGNIGTRHTDTNKFYISVLSALLVFLSLTGKELMLGNIGDLARAAIALLSILLCFAWWLNIRSFGKLYKAKFDVLREMEKELPYECFERERNLLRAEPPAESRVEKKWTYTVLTKIERVVPILMATPFLLILIFVVWKYTSGN